MSETSAAARCVTSAVTVLRPPPSRVTLIRRGADPWWTDVGSALRYAGFDTEVIGLAETDRRWRLPEVGDDGRLTLAGRPFVADVLVYHEPFGWPAEDSSDLRALYRVLDAGIGVVFVSFPHGLSASRAAAVRDAFLAALAAPDATVRAVASAVRSRLARLSEVRVRSGPGRELRVRAPFAVLDDFASAVARSVIQLPYGEVWLAAAPACFSGDVDVQLGRRVVSAVVDDGRLRWAPAIGLAEPTWPIVELGVGVNAAAAWLPPTVLFEKARGRMHVGFGDSALIGGPDIAPTHVDLPVAPHAELIPRLTWTEET